MTGAFRLDRRAALGLIAAPLLVPLARRPRAQTLDKLSFHTDWRAQAEHGGFYQASPPVSTRRAVSRSTCARAGRASTSASCCWPAGST